MQFQVGFHSVAYSVCSDAFPLNTHFCFKQVLPCSADHQKE